MHNCFSALIEKYWRDDHMDNENIYVDLEYIDEVRYAQAKRLSNLLSTFPTPSEIEEFLVSYVYLAYGTNFTVPKTPKEEKWNPSLWAGVTDTLLKRNPLPKVTNRDLVAPLKMLLSFIGSIISTFLIGSMVLAVWTVFTFLASLVCLHKKSLLGPLLVVLMSFIYALAILFLVSSLPKYESLRVGLTDGVYKMLGFYQQRTVNSNKPAAMEFVTRLLLLSAQGAFVFALCDLYLSAKYNPSGFSISSDLRYFNIFQKKRMEQQKKIQ